MKAYLLLLVPPFGAETVENLKSIFEVDHLREKAFLLNIQCKFALSFYNKYFISFSRSYASTVRRFYISGSL